MAARGAGPGSVRLCNFLETPVSDTDFQRRLDLHLDDLQRAFDREDLDRAAHALAALQALDPAAALLGRARVAAWKEDWHGVLRTLAAVQGAPNVLRGPMVRLITSALAETGRPGQAEQVVQAWLAENPADLEAVICLGRVWLRSGRLEQAHLILLQVLEQLPGNGEASAILGQVHLLRGEIEPALDSLRRACAAQPMSARPVLSLAQAWLLSGRPAEGAREVAARAGALGERIEPGVLLALATLQLQAGLDTPVPSVLRRIESGGEPGHGLRISLARLWAELGVPVEIERLAAASPSPGVAALLRALAQEAQGNDPLPDLDEAAARVPEAWLVHERRAAVLLARNDLAGAEAAIAEARRRAPTKGEVRVTAAIVALAGARIGGSAVDRRAARDVLRMAADHPALLRSLRARAHDALVHDEAQP